MYFYDYIRNGSDMIILKKELFGAKMSLLIYREEEMTNSLIRVSQDWNMPQIQRAV